MERRYVADEQHDPRMTMSSAAIAAVFPRSTMQVYPRMLSTVVLYKANVSSNHAQRPILPYVLLAISQILRRPGHFFRHLHRNSPEIQKRCSSFSRTEQTRKTRLAVQDAYHRGEIVYQVKPSS